MLRLELLHWPDFGAFSTNFIHDLNLKQDPPCLLSKWELFVSRTIIETIGFTARVRAQASHIIKNCRLNCLKKLEELIFIKTADILVFMAYAYCVLLPACTMGTL
jgi:hypothetical protein